MMINDHVRPSAQYNLSARDYWLSGDSVVLLAFLFNFVRCPCNVFDVIVLP